MADNDRVEYISGDIPHEQIAPSQASRSEFYPGKAVSREGDMNWEKASRIPTSTPAFGGEAAGPVEMERVRVVKLGRNIVSDQVLPVPTIDNVRVETRDEEGVHGENTTIDTILPTSPAEIEKQAGSDWIKGA